MEKSINKDDLCDFFIELLEKCIGIYPKDHLRAYNFCKDLCLYVAEDRIFREIERKKPNMIKDNPICYFLELLIRKDSDTYPAVYKTINLIKANFLFGAAYHDKGQDNKLYINCPDKNLIPNNFCKCINRFLSKSTDIDSSCKNCPIYKIYKSLREMWDSYELVKENTAKRYNIYVLDTENPNTSTIDDAYNSIMDYESKEHLYYKSPYKTMDQISKFNEIFEYTNTPNEQMAYVKWYSGHLASWPYLIDLYKKKSDHYKQGSFSTFIKNNEEYIWRSEMAAVAICLKLIEKGDHKWTNPNLPYNAAIDRLVSSLYMHHKYHSYYYLPLQYDTIINECNKILTIPADINAKLGLYIEMWNFSCCLGQYGNADMYADKIENLFKTKSLTTQAENTLKIRYLIYKYFNNQLNYVETIKQIIACAKALRKANQYNDTVKYMTGFFKSTIISSYEWDNIASALLGLDGYNERTVDSEQQTTNVFPENPPSAYSRIYCDCYPDFYLYLNGYQSFYSFSFNDNNVR